MIEILFLGVKSDVRSALNRLNTNWPYMCQVFAVDDYSFVEENCHQDSIFVYSKPILLIESDGWYRLTFLSLSVFRVTIYRPPSDVHLSGLQF